MKITWTDPDNRKVWIGEIEGHPDVYACVKKDANSFSWMLCAGRRDRVFYCTHGSRFQSPGDAAKAAPSFLEGLFVPKQKDSNP